MKKIIVVIYSLFFLSRFDCLYSVSIGSNTTPSRQAAITFPNADTNNTILGFAVMENGFTLQSHRTTCTYDGFFPIGGQLNTRGGRLHLLRNLVLASSFNITSSAQFYGRGLSMEFAPLIRDLVLSTTLRLDNITLILNNNTRILAPIDISGSCKITGRGKMLTLQNQGRIRLRPGANLIIEDTMIQGLNSNNLGCMTDLGSITLRDVMLYLSNQFTFSRGSIFFDEDIIVTGTNKFVYGSGLTSTINTNSLLYFDSGTTFSYAPRLPKNTLVSLTDISSVFYLNGCTLHSTRTALNLNNGTLILDNNVTLSSEGKNTGEALKFLPNLSVLILGNASASINGIIITS